ncbi:hypothetical protein ACLOJK_002829 [Asimina triloba]
MKSKSSKDRRAKDRERAKEREIERENNRRGISTNAVAATTQEAAAPAAPAPQSAEANPAVSAETVRNAEAAVSVAVAAAAQEPPAIAVAVAEGSRRRSGGSKRKAPASGGGGGSAPSPPPSKRPAKGKTQAAAVALRDGPLTRGRQSPNKAAAAAAAAAEAAAATVVGSSSDDVTQKPSDASPLPPFETLSAGEPVAPTEEPIPVVKETLAPDPAIQAELEAIISRDPNAHVVPTSAGWFSWTKIHDLEKHVLPTFFDGKSEERTPEIYMEIRNAIVNRFHSNPQTKIESKDLSEISVGNMEARQEVLEFLDSWGLINFHPFPPKESAADAADADGTAKASLLVEKLFKFEAVPPHETVSPQTEPSAPAVMPRLFSESAIADELARPEGPAVEYHCNSCSADCSRKRFHCQTQVTENVSSESSAIGYLESFCECPNSMQGIADFDLCSECYNAGKFDSGMAPADFILMESAEVPGASGGNWTDQETLLLLEALELYGENWNEIAEHVATKTKAQCILHFVQMPIEDLFLDGKDDDDGSVLGNADRSLSIRNSNVSDVAEMKDKKTDDSKEQPAPSQVDKSSSDVSVAETTGSENAAKKELPVPSKENMQKPGDSGLETDAAQEKCDSFEIRALKDAFKATGSLPTLGGLLSFAEAGNPVMTLAAFLAGLVDSDMASASARSSLKAMSEESPGVQLSARHCFLLEDPPSNWKESSASKSLIVNGRPQKEEKQLPEGGETSKNGVAKNNENPAPTKRKSAIPSQELAEKSLAGGSDGLSSAEKAISNTTKVPGQSAAPAEGLLVGDTVKKSGDLACQPVDKPCKGEAKTGDKVPESKDPEKTVDYNSKFVAGKIQGGNNTGVIYGKSGKNQNQVESTDDHNADRIKRAAHTALSAAAVKAKLLANQEEDEIQELVSLLVEKQLHKLETKLSLFAEMESSIMRAREQLDRSRQKLYHERAQIIAARLGLPAQGPRPMPPMMPMMQSGPMSKVPMNYLSPGPRLPMMTPQRPPIIQPASDVKSCLVNGWSGGSLGVGHAKNLSSSPGELVEDLKNPSSSPGVLVEDQCSFETMAQLSFP